MKLSTMLLLSKTLPYVSWNLVISTLKVLKMMVKNLMATVTHQVGLFLIKMECSV